MFKRFIILLVCLSYFQITETKAQNKYAVIVGINEYYKSPGVLSEYALKGCVNDALSMNSLLMDKFGFDRNNNTVLLNSQATQTNTTKALMDVLEKAKAGDAVVFYFCGHGIYINNPRNMNDTVKAGYNQAICMSDLYAKDYSFLMKDNTLKKIFNQFVAKKIILTTIFDCCYSGTIAMGTGTSMHNPYCDTNKFMPNGGGKSIIFEDLDTTGRAFNMGKTLTIADTAKIPRPSETKNSNFASISAASQYQKALEVFDESGVRHGALTRAIVYLYEKRNTDLSLKSALKMISEELDYQNYDQTPTFHVEASRQNKNLIGFPLQPSLSSTKAKCINQNGLLATLDVGTNNNIGIGNVFTNKKGNVQLTITKVYPNKAEARLKHGLKVANGEVFTLNDSRKVSKPLLKIYIPTLSYTTMQFNQVFNKQILPYTRLKSYRDYYNFDLGQGDHIIEFNSTVDVKKQLSAISKTPYFYIFFGLPTDLAITAKKHLQKDQNIQLVNRADSADYVLYLNYSPEQIDSKKPRFVFNYRPKVSNDPYQSTFCIYNVAVKTLPTSLIAINKLNEALNKNALSIIRKRTTNWLNRYPRK